MLKSITAIYKQILKPIKYRFLLYIYQILEKCIRSKPEDQVGVGDQPQ